MLFLESVSVAISAWVFFAVLTAPGMIFEFYYQWLERLAENGRSWTAKPLGYCGVCFAGQCGFWWYAFAHRADYVVGEHAVFTCQTIAFFLVIKQVSEIFEIWKRKNG